MSMSEHNSTGKSTTPSATACGADGSMCVWSRWRSPCRRAARWISVAAKAATRCGWPSGAGTSRRSTSRRPPSTGPPPTPGNATCWIASSFSATIFRDTFPDGAFDLVSAQFLHSMVELDRPRLLRRGAQAVSAGGTLLIVDHGGPPPWASKLHHHHEFPSADEVVGSLNLDAANGNGSESRPSSVRPPVRTVRSPRGTTT